MKKYAPVKWPCYIWWRRELKPRRKWLFWGERNQGSRRASNYGFLIVAKRGTPEYVIEQEKYESRYWTLRGFGLWYLFCRLFYPIGLCRVECASRAQEIRALRSGYGLTFAAPVDFTVRAYAKRIHNATNYPFFAAAGWSEEDVYNEITRWI